MSACDQSDSDALIQQLIEENTALKQQLAQADEELANALIKQDRLQKNNAILVGYLQAEQKDKNKREREYSESWALHRREIGILRRKLGKVN